MHEPLKNSFIFLGADFFAPKSGHRREKQPVLGPDFTPFSSAFIVDFEQVNVSWVKSYISGVNVGFTSS